MDGLQDDTGDGSMLCTEHPFKNNTPAGGICALCLQEKLGKLVSSSFPIAVFPSSSSSSPSFRSDMGSGGGGGGTSAAATTTTTVVPPRLTNSTSLLGSNAQISPANTSNECHYHQYYSNRSRILYLLTQKKKKKKDLNIIVDGGGGVHGHDRNKNLVFKRSKSTATPRRGGGLHYMDADTGDGLNSPHKRRFWSFLYLQKHSHSSSTTKKTLRDISSNNLGSSAVSTFPQVQRSRQDRDMIVVEENESPCHASFDRKVSRSRSVGCGSRSFSGDFFERISTGFGDCTLRRVESQREGKSKVTAMRRSNGQDCIKERVRCGGLFSGFMITSSSSSSSSSSYWVASNPNEGSCGNASGKVTSAGPSTIAGAGHSQQQQQHSRSKSWGWALASPMRAFSKPSSSSKKDASSNKNPTPNLAAIPSLLSVRS